MSDMLDKRRYPRVAPLPPSIGEEIPLGHPRIINVSPGGGCLWFSTPPAREKSLLLLRVSWHGHDRALRSRVVWLRSCFETPDRENTPHARGCLAGIAFAEVDGDNMITADIPPEILHGGDVTVSVLGENDAPVIRQKEGEETPAVITFSEQSLPGLKAAANDLLPIFARHFSDARLVFTRERLEVSASFRPLAELNPLEARRRDHHVIQPYQAAPPPAPVRIEQSTALLQPKGARTLDRRRLGLIAVASLGAAILGWPLFGNLRRSGNTPATPTLSVGRGSIPDWAPGLQETSLSGWIEIQKRFDLPDATVRSAIQILRKNDKYSSGQMLHDLAQYPTEVKRAFSLLASQQTGTRFDFGPLENDLKARMVEGARFPDEPPGGHHSPLQREGFNNVAVLAVIELFHRRQDDPGVKGILAALRRGRT